jgi:hypothetical protein
MTEVTESPATPARRRFTMEQSIRGWADVLALWRFCRNKGCMRARACRGDAYRCFPAFVPLLPDSLQAWMEMIGDGQEDGLSYDEAIEQMIGTEAEEALERWYNALAWSEHRLRAGRSGA